MRDFVLFKGFEPQSIRSAQAEKHQAATNPTDH